jgi:hypothetical protein
MGAAAKAPTSEQEHILETNRTQSTHFHQQEERSEIEARKQTQSHAQNESN